MALPGTPHVARGFLGFTYSTTGIKMGNVFYLEDTTDALFDDLPGMAASIGGVAVTELVPHLFPYTVINSMTLEDVRSVPFGGVTVAVSGGTGTHSSSTTHVPASVCVAIKKTTAGFGRSSRGRWYWPITDLNGLNEGNLVNSSYLDEIPTALAAFQSGVEALISGMKMGINSYYTAKAVRSSGLFQQITAWTATDNRVDSQRRRLLGRGS